MAEAQNSKDQSMEEILQSIKRIIADEEGESTADLSAHIAEEEPAVKGSDVLELRDLVEPSQSDTFAEILGAAKTEKTEDDDILSAIDAHFAASPSPAQTQAPAMSSGDDILASIDSLLEATTVKASTAALQSLKTVGTAPPAQPQFAPSSVQFRSGATLEDLVLEALKPELKQWLNANLPQMVERLVSAEIKKITGQ
jgi:uncharacterized protein